MGKITDEQWAALVGKYGEADLRRLDFKQAGTVVVRAPTAAEWKIFRQEVLNEATQPVAYEHALYRLAVFPEPAELLGYAQKRPGFTTNKHIVTAINELSGAADELEGKG